MAATPTTSKTSTPATRPTRPASIRPGRAISAGSRTLPPTSQQNAEGPSWAARATGRRRANGELVSALDGNWGEIAVKTGKAAGQEGRGRRRAGAERRRCAAGDARLHPRHHDDPRLPHARAPACRSRSAEAEGRRAGARARSARATASPRPTTAARSSSTTVLGLEYATVPEMLAILQAHLLLDASASSSCTSPILRPSSGSRSAWKGPDKEIKFTPEGKKAILNKLIEAEGFEKFLDVKYTGTKRFGLDGGEVADPGARADHQARRRAGRQGHRPRHGPSRPAQRPDPGDGEAAPRAVPRVQGRRLLPRGRRRLGRREVPPRCLVGPRVRRQQGAPVADRQPVAISRSSIRWCWARRAPSRTSASAVDGKLRRRPAPGRPLGGAAAAASMATRPLPARA